MYEIVCIPGASHTIQDVVMITYFNLGDHWHSNHKSFKVSIGIARKRKS